MKQVLGKKKKGFTLIELLLVVAIIAILGAVAIPLFMNQRRRARVTGGVSTLKSIQRALELYYQDNDAYPLPANMGSFSAIEAELDRYLSSDGGSLQKTLQTHAGYSMTPAPPDWQLNINIEGCLCYATPVVAECEIGCPWY